MSADVGHSAESDAALTERLRGDLADVTDERNVLSARLGIWESRLTEHTPHDNCAASEPCYEWGFANGWKAAMEAYQCWCGSPVGVRVPGDSRGVGCLADITHNWTGTTVIPPGDGAHKHEWIQQIGPGITSRHVCSVCRATSPGVTA